MINDYSNDNSLRIIKQFKKEDPRIIIINNHKNMGTLYSRCIGALNAKGEYIFPLDNDDMFFNYDVFDFIYKTGKKGNYDIVAFKSILINNYNFDDMKELEDNPFSIQEDNLTLHQPELGVYPISKNGIYKKNDYNIWGKSIKSEIYKEGVNVLGKNKYSQFISWGEDSSILFIICNIAKSFNFVNKYGIFHLISNNTASNTQPKKNKFFGSIFFLEIIFNFSKKYNKNFAVYHALSIKEKYDIEKYKNESLYLKNVLSKIINSKYIKQKFKRKIKKVYNFI